MLLSVKKRFLFIANVKTASTAIEKALSPHCDIRLTESEYGKHLTFSEVVERFGWLLNAPDMPPLFMFGVVRDPVDFVLSLYNAHRHKFRKDDEKLYTGDMDFSTFIAEWVPRNADQLKSQRDRFIARDGSLKIDLLISYDRLDAGLKIVAERIGAPELLRLPRLNKSPKGLTRADLSAAELTWIEARFRDDVDFIARHADRLAGAEILPETAPARPGLLRRIARLDPLAATGRAWTRPK